MTRKATSHNKLKGCLWALFKYFSIFLLLCAFYVAFFLFLKKDACVKLPNGYMIGHPAIFHRNKRLSYEMVLRDPDGNVVFRTDDWIQFHRHPTNSDLVVLEYKDGTMKRLEMPGHDMMEIIFPSKKYGRKWNEKREAYPNDTSILLTGLASVLFKLERHKRFRTPDCNTPWFDW